MRGEYFVSSGAKPGDSLRDLAFNSLRRLNATLMAPNS